MAPEATILIPTHNRGPALRETIASALGQTASVEVLVVGDGVNAEYRETIRQLTESEERVQFFDRPKGPRHGEIHRHEALTHARGSIVCYLSDDDLYLPDHVAHMMLLLRDADFAHALTARVWPDGSCSTWTVDLNLAPHRRELMEGRNRIPLSAAAHTVGAYRNLVEGWSGAPSGIATDLHMWQKFLRHPDLRFRAGHKPTVLVFPSPYRPSMNPQQRHEELRGWVDGLRTAEQRAAFEARIFSQKVQEAAELDAQIVNARVHGGRLLEPDLFQVFFPGENGHSESESARFPLQLSLWQTITCTIPRLLPGIEVRIDPANQPCLIEVANLRLLDAAGTVLWELTDSTCAELRLAGTAVWISQGRVARIVSDGTDPQLLLPPLPASQVNSCLCAAVRIEVDIAKLSQMLSDNLRVPRL